MVLCACRIDSAGLLAAQYLELELRHVDHFELVSTLPRTFGAGQGERVAEALTGRIRMTLDKSDAPGDW